MRLLVLTKRQYTTKDLLDDRFGRLRELPLALARCGQEVTGICLSYRDRDEGTVVDEDRNAGVRVIWHSVNAGRTKLPGLVRFMRQASKLAHRTQPDVILAFSDSFYGIMGVQLARRLNSKCVFDLYDNFESFGSTSIPGMLPLYKRAVRVADGVTCVSNALMHLVRESYKRDKPTALIPNAIDSSVFYPRDKAKCRQALGLPLDATIIGTAGALHKNRGIDALFRGFEALSKQEANIHLAVAGSRDRATRLPSGPRVHDLSVLPLSKVPLLLSSLDVAVVCNKDSLFGRYCFPQKAYEIIACRVPMVAADVGAMKELMHPHAQYLFKPDDPSDLARAVRAQLDARFVPDGNVPTWDDVAGELERFLHSIAENDSA
ncbi:MAG: glycosyltransferase [Acidiferrobacterales bacterium]